MFGVEQASCPEAKPYGVKFSRKVKPDSTEKDMDLSSGKAIMLYASQHPDWINQTIFYHGKNRGATEEIELFESSAVRVTQVCGLAIALLAFVL